VRLQLITQRIINMYKQAAKRKMERNCLFLPVATGKCSESLLDSLWAQLKGYRKATEKCP
jgi:hypothetical protein